MLRYPIDKESPEGQIFVCGACGKTSRTRMPTRSSAVGWDESCMLNAVLCYSEKDSNGKWRAVPQGDKD